MRPLPVLIIAVALLGGCSSQSAALAPSAAAGAATPTPAASSAGTTTDVTPEPTAGESAQPTPEATPAGPVQYKPGEAIVLTKDGSNSVQIVVSKVSQKTAYPDTYYTDKPKVKGDVFIQAFLTYTALEDGVSYNPFDWQVFADGEAVKTMTFLMNGPEPGLSSGTLPKGRKASGWVVYEVPAKGEILLSYAGNMFMNEAPICEVVLRSK